MFIGHFGLGFAAKRAQPQLSLGTAFLAAQFLDLLWPTLLLLGVETVAIEPGATAVTPLLFEHYPVSHSLAGALAWGVLVALVHAIAARPAPRTSLLVAALVVSHWLLDALVHAPDLPLAPGLDARIGLGLWDSPAATLLLETALFAAGVWAYATATRPRDRTGRIALVTLVAFLALVQAANVFGPPPPNVGAIVWAGHAQWLLVAWGYWVDAHRMPVARPWPRTWRP